ncbi:MAG: amino acid adenylation domain-containing protein, partial [Dehalococcoidia bacterium]
QPVSQLPILSAEERHQILVEWNEPQSTFPQERCIHQEFEAQVQRTPDAVAIVCEGQQLTYRELNEQANQLAHYLQARGVVPDMLVGVFLERSIPMVVGLLGILKAGAAYLPLDPESPPERSAFVLEDAQVSVLVTQHKLMDSLPTVKLQKVSIDADWPEITKESTENPSSQAAPDHLAYAIYTSGSTGTPKGVLISHYNVARLFQATDHWFGFGESDVWSCFHSYAFDVSVYEIWGALLHGGRLVMVPYLVSRTPEAFYNLLCDEQVTVLSQTPSAFRQLIRVEDTLDRSQEMSLRLVLFAGEALEYQSLKPWLERHGDESPQLINLYGITETTVHTTYRRVMQSDLSSGDGSVIGCPFPDLQIHILDANGEPTPVGVPGEIHVGGAGLARGYLNRPELTAERFIPNPFSDDPAARLYASGDEARYLPNGDIEYLGRLDFQVKIRGFRIELGEIEALLGSYPGVRENVVIAREDASEDQRLIAYIVSESAAKAGSSDLRDFLKPKLPGYMVPSSFVMLEELPLTGNGKVDRRALPAPDQNRPDLAQTYLAPRDEVEQELARIWREVLNVEQIGVNDNFFELGGHSLLATRAISRMRESFQIENLSLGSFFENPTVSALAHEIKTAWKSQGGSVAVISSADPEDREEFEI